MTPQLKVLGKALKKCAKLIQIRNHQLKFNYNPVHFKYKVIYQLQIYKQQARMLQFIFILFLLNVSNNDIIFNFIKCNLYVKQLTYMTFKSLNVL